MAKDSIWLVDDDRDDQELIRDTIKELNIPNEIEFFTDAKHVLNRFKDIKNAPFIILCDVNLPGMGGFELREKLLDEPDRKFHSVPFIFWSTFASESQIAKAFRLRAHGFFIKETEYKEWKKTLAAIITYWTKSRIPSKKEAPDEPMRY